jgi:hypothetical protein
VGVKAKQGREEKCGGVLVEERKKERKKERQRKKIM